MSAVRRPLVVATALVLCATAPLALGATAFAAPAPVVEQAPAAAAHAAAPAPQRDHRATDEPSLTGTAKLQRKPGEDIHFTFDAHGFADKAKGTFSFSHYNQTPEGRWGGYAKGRIDCLLTGGPVAVVTGVVTESEFTFPPDFPGPKNINDKRFGFTVLDGGKGGKRDRLGYSWAMDGMALNSVPKCVSSAPYETLEKGNFTVHHWMPPQTAAKEDTAAKEEAAVTAGAVAREKTADRK